MFSVGTETQSSADGTQNDGVAQVHGVALVATDAGGLGLGLALGAGLLLLLFFGLLALDALGLGRRLDVLVQVAGVHRGHVRRVDINQGRRAFGLVLVDLGDVGGTTGVVC